MKKHGPFHAEHIDGVQLPLQRRNYDCPNYNKCLSLAGGLDWDDFTCEGCVGEINQSLFWQIRQAQRKDSIVKEICDVPNALAFESEGMEKTAANESDLPEEKTFNSPDTDKASGTK